MEPMHLSLVLSSLSYAILKAKAAPQVHSRTGAPPFGPTSSPIGDSSSPISFKLNSISTSIKL